MWLRNPLDDVLSSKAKVAILRVVSQVNAPLSGREIARRAGIWPSAASQALRELTASGVLTRQDHGSAKTYELADTDVELLAQIRGLFRAEAGRYREFVADLMEAIPEARSLVLFGSEARDEARPGSDTDLLVVVDGKSEALEEMILAGCLELAERFGLALSWHIADMHDIRQWEASGNQFWKSVLRDGIRVQGESLEALGRQCRQREIS